VDVPLVYTPRGMEITAHQLLFLLGSFAVPSLLVILNFIVRKNKNWYFTAGSDFLLSLATFNLSSAILVQDVSPYIRDPLLREASTGVFVTSALILLISWWFIIDEVETAVHKAIRDKKALSFFPQFKLFCSWVCVVVFTGLELAVFFYP
jgi:hypothetical protein